MKTLPGIDAQWEPIQDHVRKLCAQAERLIHACHSNDYKFAAAATREIQGSIRRINYDLGYMSGFYAACEQREKEDEEGVLSP